MKRNLIMAVFFLIAWAGLFVPASPALAFNSGSTGADGAFAPTASTEVALPVDGKLNYTTVNIPAGVTVTFKPNAANTPVYILATGDVTIAGAISVSGTKGDIIIPGKGGQGGFDGGIGGATMSCGGSGLGQGGGIAALQVASSMIYGAGGGGGGYGAAGAVGGTINPAFSKGGAGGGTYGNADIIPFVGGSGGGGACGSSGYVSSGGGGGGGAILIASSGTINITGALTADGGAGGNYGWCCYTFNGNGGGGSGGAIRLIADILKGEGMISATGGAGGTGGYSAGGAGGAGRIRIEVNTISRTSNTTPPYVFGGAPIAVFPTIKPSLNITKIGGIAVPSIPTGTFSSPDIVLPTTTANPIAVVVEASNIPSGSTVTVTIVPEFGQPSSATALLSGTDSLSTATVQSTFSTRTINIVMAAATFTLTASNSMPLYAEGERVVKMKVASVLGGKSSIIYITESGKEVQAAM